MTKIRSLLFKVASSSFVLQKSFANPFLSFTTTSLPTFRMDSMNSSPNANTGLCANELVEIVDEANNPVEPRLRFEMRRDKLRHRATYAFVKTSGNYFYVQKRSMLKDYCPGFYDANPGGVVAAGESYEVTNARELEEEMGIKDANHERLFTFYYEDERIRCFGDAWETQYDGPLKLQVEEVDSVHLMSLEEILQRNEAGEPFTPDSIFACREYVKLKGFPRVIGPKPEPVLYEEIR